ncbi:MurR/RpiR family transcriptional regulator [Paenibacillus allorhizosphaerae]|uniref:HTH-type transcriptional regulator YbbH n=1 Tax=Paenibacillus allorhizosphaerae TaxID=2849866 RepID=A0ABN7TUM5_9BACL|nr:MurR/RpiR family transcriptional regulator [Paenibacillus allorhizosphaerae]CAG7652687.1 putative HTH-type transcriptional regulator YbbH [Paenibacillus allorhizosphaerae]
MRELRSSQASGLTGGVLQAIGQVYNQLRKSEKAVADYTMRHPEETINSNISDIAQECQVSEATVIRFCKAVGFSGFQDLKINLARLSTFAEAPTLYENIRKEDSLETAIGKIHSNNVQALNGTFQNLDLTQLQKAAQALADARMIYLFGFGTSGLVAEYAAYRFTRIGLLTKSCTDSHHIALSTALVKRGDVVLAVSQSGSTKSIVESLEEVKRRGAFTVTITGYPRSPVARTSHIALRSAVHETPFESGGMPSLMAQLSVVDALMVGASLEHFDESITMIQATTEALKSKKY